VSRTEYGQYGWWGWGGEKEYYLQDVLGSTMGMVDNRGVEKTRYSYDAFGVTYEGSLQWGNEIGYTGKRYSAWTGLYDYGFRDYMPQAGRFTTVDPIRSGNNWYAYVSNDPINYVDLLGLSASDKAAFETWTASGKEYIAGVYVKLDSGVLYEAGYSQMTFSNETTTFKQDYIIQTTQSEGFALGVSGQVLKTSATAVFPKGTSPEEVAKSWEGPFTSSNVSVALGPIPMAVTYTEYSSSTWHGSSWGAGLSVGFPASVTATLPTYKESGPIYAP
jgi:RHS repeat-associated protein